MRFLFVMFIVIPVVEMAVLIKVGSYIGAGYTILLVLLTAMIGVTLLKRQGLRTLMNANQKMRYGEMPVEEMGEGLMLAVAGALLLTPGFVTDTVGFLLLTPGIRSLLNNAVKEALLKGMQNQNLGAQVHYRHTEYRQEGRSDSEDVIEGEFREVKKDED